MMGSQKPEVTKSQLSEMQTWLCAGSILLPSLALHTSSPHAFERTVYPYLLHGDAHASHFQFLILLLGRIEFGNLYLAGLIHSLNKNFLKKIGQKLKSEGRNYQLKLRHSIFL